MHRLFACIREPDFHLMYGSLGNWQKQEDIRKARPEVKHCAFLQHSPRACECLPSEAEGSAGKRCPNNPYERFQKEYAKLREIAPLLCEAFHLRNLSDLGQLPPPERLLAEEFQVAAIMRDAKRSDLTEEA